MRDNYDDLMGLDMYDDGMSEFVTMEMLKESVIAAGSSAAAILLATWGLPKLAKAVLPDDMSEPNKHRIYAVMQIVAGLAAGRGLWNYNKDAAMAVIGGISGLGIAHLVDTFFEADLGPRFQLGAYPDSDTLSAGDAALLSAYGSDNGRALASLEATNIRPAAGAFSGFAGPVISQEALMGAVVQQETLGAYNPYLS